MYDRNEASSNVYTTDVMTKMFKEEGGQLFDSRSAQLGHTLQGGVPSPIDRARAVRLSLKCMTFMEREWAKIQSSGQSSPRASPESAAVITIQSGSIKWVPVRDMVQHADMKNRRPLNPWWMNVKEMVESLAGRPQLVKLHAWDFA